MENERWSFYFDYLLFVLVDFSFDFFYGKSYQYEVCGFEEFNVCWIIHWQTSDLDLMFVVVLFTGVFQLFPSYIIAPSGDPTITAVLLFSWF